MQRWGQMLDEVPMLWTVVFFLFTTLTIDEAPYSPRSTALGLGLLAYALVNSAVYFAGGFVWFILAYIAAVVAVFASTARHMLQEENREHAMIRHFGCRAMGFYAAGFLVFWVPEQVLCGNQVGVRRRSFHPGVDDVPARCCFIRGTFRVLPFLL
jgi:hypothetical protein